MFTLHVGYLPCGCETAYSAASCFWQLLLFCPQLELSDWLLLHCIFYFFLFCKYIWNTFYSAHVLPCCPAVSRFGTFSTALMLINPPLWGSWKSWVRLLEVGSLSVFKFELNQGSGEKYASSLLHWGSRGKSQKVNFSWSLQIKLEYFTVRKCILIISYNSAASFIRLIHGFSCRCLPYEFSKPTCCEFITVRHPHLLMKILFVFCRSITSQLQGAKVTHHK